MENVILSNIDEKLKSGFYLDRISINGIEFEVYEKNEECLALLCKTGIQMMVVMGLLFAYHFLLDLMRSGLRNIEK